MESLFILALLVIFLIVVAPILLFVGQSNLKKRVASLEAVIKRLETDLGRRPAVAQASRSERPTTETDASAAHSDQANRKTTPADAAEASAPERSAQGPWETPKPDPQPATAAPPAPTPPRVVERPPSHYSQLIDWLKENWVLAAGAVSLALAGVFLVQYGAERGLLTPPARVLVALAFGLLLLIGGEVLRRRFGDEAEGPTRFLPSALSGAGFLTLFAAILAARVLYGLIGPTTAFGGLTLISLASILFGWFYGPLLSAIGVVGAIAAPYLVGGDTETPWLLSYYFALIALAALAIDSIKRWAWLSVLALAGAAGSIWLIYLGAGFPVHFLAATSLLVIAGLTIPERQLVPRLDGPPVSALAFGQRAQRFPTWLGFAVTANATIAGFGVAAFGNLAEGYLGLGFLSLLFSAALFWLFRASSLIDLAVLPALGIIGVVVVQPETTGALFATFKTAPAPETAASAIGWQLAAMGSLGTLLLFLRLSRTNGQTEATLFGLTSAIFAPITVFLLEFLWLPAEQYGATGWALVVVGVAVLMTLLSERAARLKSASEPKLLAAFFAAAALSLIGLALFLVLTKAALTIALAMMVLAVIGIDRRFDLPLLGLFVQLGILIISYRVVVDPGIDWAVDRLTNPFGVALGFFGTGAVLLVAWLFAHPDRPRQKVSIEGGLSILLAAGIFVAFSRLLPDALERHWGVGLLATLWLVVALAQLRGLDGAGRFERILRYCLGAIMGGLTALAIIYLFVVVNPLTSFYEPVSGLPPFNSLALAYLPLAGVLGLVAGRMSALPPQLRLALGAGAGFLVVWYVALTIRHFWQGPLIRLPGVSDPELYSYTVAMLLGATGLLAYAFSRRSRVLRKVAMGAVGLTIAKVFLIDMAGLTGLMRVLSFMGLGLALLALTWLNRVMEAQWDKNTLPAPNTEKS